MRPHSPSRSRSGKVIAGLILLAVGTILFLRIANLVIFPNWLFTWPVFLILIGLVSGVKNQFRNPGAFVMIIIGSMFLMGEVYTDISLKKYIAPIIFIFFGLWLIFGRNRESKFKSWNDKNNPNDPLDPTQPPVYPITPEPHQTYPIASANSGAHSSSDYIDSVNFMGGVKKNILSKKFKGGEITCFMGGAEINLTQADIQGRVVIDVTQVMGGTKFIVPSNWDVISEMTSVFGGIEDKRMLHPAGIDPNKVLIIKGTSVFGGTDISSY